MLFNKLFERKLRLATVMAGALAGTLVASGGAIAGAPADGLKSWAAAANQSVDDVMQYPRMTIRGSGNGAARFNVTINRSGEVVTSDQVQRINSSILNSAAKKVLRQADFPALPTSYKGDSMTFVLQLNYGAGKDVKLPRQGRVTSRQIASATGQSGIELVNAEANAD